MHHKPSLCCGDRHKACSRLGLQREVKWNRLDNTSPSKIGTILKAAALHAKRPSIKTIFLKICFNIHWLWLMLYSCGNKANYSRKALFKCHLLMSSPSVLCYPHIQPHSHNNVFMSQTWKKLCKSILIPSWQKKRTSCVFVTIWRSLQEVCVIVTFRYGQMHISIIPGMQHWRVLAPEHLSLRYRSWQM